MNSNIVKTLYRHQYNTRITIAQYTIYRTRAIRI